MLFTDRSIWTMVHGIGLGGAALMGLAAALFYLHAARMPAGSAPSTTGARSFAMLTALTAGLLWLTVLTGTYIIFPPYRAAAPVGAADLSGFPRALIMARAETVWLHALAMESKEHMPWIASMLATAVAFVAARDPSRLLADGPVRRTAMILLAVCVGLVSFVSLMGVFVNKVAPLQ